MYLTLNELVEEIQKNIEALQAGRMELDEVEAHLDLVRELHERTIILKYKALEAKAVRKEVVEETPIVENVAPVVEQQEVKAPVVETPVVEEKEEEPQGFDLFGSMFAVEETPEVIQPVVEEIKEEAPVVTPIVEEVIETVEEEIVLEEEPLMEEIEEEYIQEEVAPVIEETVVEEEVAPVVETPVVEASNKHLAAFAQRLKEVNAEVSNQFGFSPLNTLIGSFGLNERLLYINELFGGSSEAFSDAVKDLDSLHSLEQAGNKILSYADINMWDVESSTVTEFMQKLCRRYA